MKVEYVRCRKNFTWDRCYLVVPDGATADEVNAAIKEENKEHADLEGAFFSKVVSETVIGVYNTAGGCCAYRFYRCGDSVVVRRFHMDVDRNEWKPDTTYAPRHYPRLSSAMMAVGREQ